MTPLIASLEKLMEAAFALAEWYEKEGYETTEEQMLLEAVKELRKLK